MKKFMSKIDDNILKCTHILFQIILITIIIYLARYKPELNKYIMVLIILSIGNAMNYYLLLANRRKKLVWQGSFISIISTIYIVTNIFILRYFRSWNIYIFYHLLLMVMVVYYTKLYAEGLIYGGKYYELIAVYGLLLYVSKLFSYNLFITIFQGGYFVIGIFPIYIITKYKNKLNKFARYSYKSLFLMTLIFSVILVVQFFLPIIDFSGTNIDIYATAIFLEIIKLSLERIYLKVQNYMLIWEDNGFSLLLRFISLNILSFILTKDVSLMLIFSTEVILLTHMFDRLRFTEKNNTSIDGSLSCSYINEYLYKQEALYNERTISFLHDEILQYIIVALRQVKDDNFFENRDSIINLLQETINITREEINLYKPKIRKEAKTYEAYITLINDLKDRFKNDEILIDFNCDEKLELVEPYISVIYKCIHEIIINIFKHSKGHYSEISLYQKEDKIFLTSVNHGDYMDIENKNKVKNVGLKILDLEVKRLGGKMNMKMDANNLLEEEESRVAVNIEIPIKREVIYEHFINRRS